MDALIAHRLQFAFTVAYHYLSPQLTIGLALLIVVLKTMGLRGDTVANEAARVWTKVFGLGFVMGVVTGIPLEFQFGSRRHERMIRMTLATPLSTVFAPALIVGLAMVALPAERAEAKKGEATADAKIADVTFLREEEKLARDVYLTLHKRWGLRIFDNISRSEQRHMDRMHSLLMSYGAPDPVKSDEVGAFTNPELAALYKKLTRQGEKSETQALLVGATIEDLDIRDIAAMKKRTSASDALDAFDKLQCGSRNHMRAFSRQLAARGVAYEAQYMTAAELAAIIEGDHEQCGRMGSGQGRGGQGHGARGRSCGSECNCERGN